MFDNCEIFNPEEDGFEIRRIAKGVSLEEAAQCFGYDFEELPKDDQRFLRAMHARGRAEAKVNACENFFEKMRSSPNGGQLAAQYLALFGDEWPRDGVSVQDNGFSFKVMLDK